jgi:hypothetical protein
MIFLPPCAGKAPPAKGLKGLFWGLPMVFPANATSTKMKIALKK